MENKNKLFNTTQSVFQQKINDIMKEDDILDLIDCLIKLQMFKNSEKDEKKLILVELYKLLGTSKFMDMMDICSGKTIKFPSKEDFKETIQIALCYYYKQFKDYSWDDIKALINDEDLSSVKLGIKIQQLQRFIDHYGELRTRKIIKKAKELN